MPHASAIVARELRVGYGQHAVLDAVSFALPRRRTTVILGPGGSGKSTLLRALAGGDGAPDGMWTEGELTRPCGTIGFLCQKGTASSRSLAELLGAQDGYNGAAKRRLTSIWRCAAGAARVLRPCVDEPINRLPSSHARLAEFTAVAASGADALLFDEPDAGLGDGAREWVAAKLSELRRTATVLLVTHHVSLASVIADYLLILVDGAVVEAGRASQVLRRPAHARTAHFLRMGC